AAAVAGEFLVRCQRFATAQRLEIDAARAGDAGLDAQDRVAVQRVLAREGKLDTNAHVLLRGGIRTDDVDAPHHADLVAAHADVIADLEAADIVLEREPDGAN